MRRRGLDLAPSVLLGALGLAQIAGLDAGDRLAGPAWLDALALLACVVPLAWRRRFPGATLLAVVVANLIWTQVLFAPTDEVVLETWFALLVAVWAVAVDGHRRDLPLVTLAAVLEIGEAVAEQLRGVPPSQQAVPAISFVAAAAAGWAVRYYRRTAALLEQRTRELARERDERAAEAVELERGRIRPGAARPGHARAERRRPARQRRARAAQPGRAGVRRADHGRGGQSHRAHRPPPVARPAAREPR